MSLYQPEYKDVHKQNYPFENIIFIEPPINCYSLFATLSFTNCVFRNCEFESYSAYGYGLYFVHCTFENCAFYTKSILSDFSDCIFLNCSFPDGLRSAFNLATRFSSCSYDNSILEPLYKEMRCPTSGEFIGWKKAYLCKRVFVEGDAVRFSQEVIVKLLIPEESKRSSSIGSKCRCEKAMVLEVQTEDGCKIDIPEDCFVASIYEFESSTAYNIALYADSDKLCTRYIPGEMVYPSTFDTDSLVECGGGIHFFMTREEALDYSFY